MPNQLMGFCPKLLCTTNLQFNNMTNMYNKTLRTARMLSIANLTL